MYLSRILRILSKFFWFILIALIVSSCGSLKRASANEIISDTKETINADVTEKADSSRVEVIYSINDSTKEHVTTITEVEFEIVLNPRDSNIVSLPKTEKVTEIRSIDKAIKEEQKIVATSDSQEKDDNTVKITEKSVVSKTEDVISQKDTNVFKYIFYILLLIILIYLFIKSRAIFRL
jgi:predicted RND superfamily exporter protein